MEVVWLLIGVIAILAILGGARKGSGSEYHKPPDYEDDPPPPMGASKKAIEKWDKEHSRGG